nr:uncharacterized protein LOC100183823 isoform X1 [Ciona intestinalis]|eukprot:XP_018673326.1 uncharacterized protein LOC100183823 isoform X1 [Ciona intestinalis]
MRLIMNVILTLDQLLSDIQVVHSTVLWRGDFKDISTKLFQRVPAKYHPDIIQRGEISAALCYAILQSYPGASVSNFRQFTDSQLIFTVEEKSFLVNDVESGKANQTLGSFLASLSENEKLDFSSFGTYRNIKRFIFTTDTSIGITKTQQEATKELPSQPEPEVKPTINKEVPVLSESSSCTEEDQTTDLFASVAYEDAAFLMDNKRFQEALTLLEQCTLKGEQCCVQLRISLCLRECNRRQEADKLLHSTIHDLKTKPPTSKKISLASSIVKIAKMFGEYNAFSRSVLILLAAAQLLASVSCDNVAGIELMNIMACLRRFQSKSDQSYRINEMIHKSMLEVFKLLKEFTFKTKSEEVDTVSHGHRHLAASYEKIFEATKAEEQYKAAVEILENGFGESAKLYYNYAICTHNIAVKMEERGDMVSAKVWFTNAIERHKAAEDWSTEQEREKAIELSIIGLSKISV